MSSPSSTSFISSSDQRELVTIKKLLKDIPRRIITGYVVRIKTHRLIITRSAQCVHDKYIYGIVSTLDDMCEDTKCRAWNVK